MEAVAGGLELKTLIRLPSDWAGLVPLAVTAVSGRKDAAAVVVAAAWVAFCKRMAVGLVEMEPRCLLPGRLTQLVGVEARERS